MTRDIGEEARDATREPAPRSRRLAGVGAALDRGSLRGGAGRGRDARDDRAAGDDFDGVVIACYGDPGLFAAREISPVPVVGIAEASMLMACTVAHRFSIVSVLPRVKPMLEDMVALHGLASRCASIRTTPLTVLDCERDPTAARREIVVAARAARRRGRRGGDLPRLRRDGAARQGRGRARRRPGARRRRLRREDARGGRRLRAADEPRAAFKEPEPKELTGSEPFLEGLRGRIPAPSGVR